MYCTVVDGSYPVGEGTNLPKLSDSKNIYYYLFFIIFYPTVDCLFIWSQHWSLFPLVRNLPDQPIILKCALFNQVS